MSKIIKEKGKFYYQNEKGNIDLEDEITEIRVCTCNAEYKVPLISTFAFNRAEYWCPYCGANFGMFGAGEVVPITKELVSRANKYKDFTKDYLGAVIISVCSIFTFKGKRITPDELPQKEKDKNENIIKTWKYNVKV